MLVLASGLSFITAQAHLVAIHVFYPLAMALLVAGSTPIGLGLLRAQSDSEQTGRASARV